MTTAFHWNSYRYFPYERRLATLEVASLSGNTPRSVNASLEVDGEVPRNVARRFTYFREVVSGQSSVVPDQARFELSAPNGRMPAASSRARASKQMTRYSAHGLHEYRGKFNPQIVRAACNILRLGKEALLLDPFCGSGTTILEACHMGFDAVGLDLHRLAAEIANAKIAVYRSTRQRLRDATAALMNELTPFCDLIGNADKLSTAIDARLSASVADLLPNTTYLREWFPELVLKQLALMIKVITEQVPGALAPVFRIVLSDIVRSVSWQEPADLRIRRRREPAENYPALPLFVESVRKKIDAVLSSPKAPRKGSRQIAFCVDTREAEAVKSALVGFGGPRKADAVVSSPPYATALPYVDTHRLSLCLLGLLDADSIRAAEKSLIGNREINRGERRLLEARIANNSGGLPPACHRFCLDLQSHAAHRDNGFRRRNTPSLLYKYLEDMMAAFRSIRPVLKDQAPVALVVGPNRCSLGGREFVIETPELLRETAEAVGYSCRDTIPLDTYHRYDLHQQNSIRKEVLLILQRE